MWTDCVGRTVERHSVFGNYLESKPPPFRGFLPGRPSIPFARGGNRRADAYDNGSAELLPLRTLLNIQRYLPSRAA